MTTRLVVPESARVALSAYRTITSLPVQWGDQDPFGHVNNVIYFRWFESARVDLVRELSCDLSMTNAGTGPILASIKCDYRKQLRFPDTLHIGTAVSRLGRSSFELCHAIFSEQWQAIAAEGCSTLVVFDYVQNRPVKIPDHLRADLESALLRSAPGSALN